MPEIDPQHPTLTPRRRRVVTWALIFAVWTFIAIFFVSQVGFQYANQKLPFPWWQQLFAELIYSYLWFLVTPAVFLIDRRFPIERGRRLTSTVVHVLASVIVAAAHAFVLALIVRVIGSTPITDSVLQHGWNVIVGNLHLNLMFYWGTLGVYYIVNYYRRYQERAFRASQLEVRLAQAQLQVLKMQLHPHFLFNTLHAVTALMLEDVDAATRMLVRLSDLLRITLENPGEQEATLKQEMEFIERYLDIESIRFQDRLKVSIDIHPKALDAMVPNLFLQPLVENALRHGVARCPGPARVEIRAYCDAGNLYVQISNDGPKLRDGVVDNKGIGLSNTQARLEQLYGAAASLRMSNSDHGVIADVTIPFRNGSGSQNGESRDDTKWAGYEHS